MLQNRSSSDLQCRYLEARKAAAQAVKLSEERSREEFGRLLDSKHSSANKVFWQTICRLHGKRLCTTTSIKDSTGNIFRNEKKILSRWKEYFEDLLNPLRAIPTDTYHTIEFCEAEVFTWTEVAAAIQGLKSRKDAGEDEIQPEMLKALNGEGIR